MQIHEPVEELVSHRGNMLMVESVLAWDEESASVLVNPASSALFVQRDGTVPAWVALEYMAQAIAVYAGKAARTKGEPIKLGFLLGTRKFSSRVDGFCPQDQLIVNVRKLLHDEHNLVLFSCHLLLDGEEVATAEIKAIQPDDPTLLLSHFAQ